MSDEMFENTDEAIGFLHNIGAREQEAGELLEGRIEELESALASERAKLEEALNDGFSFEGKWRESEERALAAEATIERVREWRADAQDWIPVILPDRLDYILTNADTSALAQHDAEVAARALEEAADIVHAEVREQWSRDEKRLPGAQIVAQRMTVIENTVRARAAEKRDERLNTKEADLG